MLVFTGTGQAQVMGCLLSKEDLKQVSKEEDEMQLTITDAKRKKDSQKYLVDIDILHDPWGTGEKVDNEDEDIAEVHGGDKKENVSIIDLRAAHSAIQSVHDTKTVGKHSESQTEPADGVDFDWDLSDKTDIETQVVMRMVFANPTLSLYPRLLLPPVQDHPTHSQQMQ